MHVWIQNPFDNLPLEGYRKQRYWLMAEAFARAGHDVVLWSSDFSHATKRRRAVKDEGQRRNFRLVLLPTRPYFRNVSVQRVLSHRAYAREWLKEGLLLGSTQRPDIIISSIPTISAAETALMLGRHLDAKVVIDVMDAWPETFERLLPASLRSLAHAVVAPLRRRARRVYRAADLVTGVCDRYRDLTARADYYRAYHGVEIHTSSPSSSSSSSSLRLVYAGGVGRTYDLQTVLAAVAANSDFTLDIAGKWCGGIQERVKTHGYLGQAELRDLLEGCDVGIVPMKDDSWVGLPYKLCDYAMAGLSIVSSLEGETASLLTKYRCGTTYRPGDAQSLAAAVRRAAALGRDGARRMCEEELDAAKIYADYVAAVEKLV